MTTTSFCRQFHHQREENMGQAAAGGACLRGDREPRRCVHHWCVFSHPQWWLHSPSVGQRPYAQRGLLKFAAHTGATPIAGRFTPGASDICAQRTPNFRRVHQSDPEGIQGAASAGRHRPVPGPSGHHRGLLRQHPRHRLLQHRLAAQACRHRHPVQ